jgi:ABC-2 type transport system ATP-binding protein
VIEARALARRFRARSGKVVEALRGVDLDVAPGQIAGLLGPNGAGKTTVQRLLSTLLLPTAGRAQVAGRDLLRDPAGVRRRIGYVGQGRSTNPDARIDEELELQAQLHGASLRDARRRAAELRALLELDGLGDRTVRTLSGGQRRRLELALGLVHAPDVLFLDEPSSGLDPQTRAHLWAHVRAIREQRGVAILLTTHYLEEADALCDRLFVLDQGRLIAAGAPAELKRRISGDLVTLRVAGSAAEARALLDQQPRVRELACSGDAVQARVDNADEHGLALLRWLEGRGISVRALEIQRPTLDDVFLTLTGRSLRDERAGDSE